MRVDRTDNRLISCVQYAQTVAGSWQCKFEPIATVEIAHITRKPSLDRPLQQRFSSYMTVRFDLILTFELNLNNVRVNQHTKYLDERSFGLKAIVWTQAQTDTHCRSTALHGPLRLAGSFQGRSWYSSAEYFAPVLSRSCTPSLLMLNFTSLCSLFQAQSPPPWLPVLSSNL